MCRMQCVLSLLALYLGLVQSWDIAVSTGDVLDFFTNGIKTDTVRFRSQNLTALAYDDVYNMMLFVDKQTDRDAICGYNLPSMDVTCFVKRNGSNIHSLAFDPFRELLFFTDTSEKSINWVSLKNIVPGYKNGVYGNLLIKIDDGTPTDIAVDSCKGHIYLTITNILKYDRIERARIDGSERKILYKKLVDVFSLAIDQQKQKIYFFDASKYSKYFNSADFNGQNEEYVVMHIRSEPKVLTVSKDYLYWINSSVNYKTVWRMPKNALKNGEIKEIGKFYNDGRIGIAAKYKMREQIQGIQDCEALTSLVPNNADELFCVHGMKVSGQSVCKCLPGYTGERCEVSVCRNYCLHGNCSYKHEELPKCSCNAGYSGERCEVSVCFNYCLNDGDCSLNEKDAPVCQCDGKHEGSRCEAVKNVSFTSTDTPTYYSAKRNLSVADLLLNWRKPTAKITITVEV